jgi:hypothetical protein
VGRSASLVSDPAAVSDGVAVAPVAAVDESGGVVVSAGGVVVGAAAGVEGADAVGGAAGADALGVVAGTPPTVSVITGRPANRSTGVVVRAIPDVPESWCLSVTIGTR